MLPIVVCLYGCTVNVLSYMISERRPYGWLSIAQPPLLLDHFALALNVSLSILSVAIRSASSHRTSGRYCDGTVSQNTVASSVV